MFEIYIQSRKPIGILQWRRQEFQSEMWVGYTLFVISKISRMVMPPQLDYRSDFNRIKIILKIVFRLFYKIVSSFLRWPVLSAINLVLPASMMSMIVSSPTNRQGRC